MDTTSRASVAALEKLAVRLRNAQATRTPCPPLIEDVPHLRLSEAYQIQRINVRAHMAGSTHSEPRTLVGHKIGLTSEAVMKWLNVREPDFGCLTSDMVVPNGGLVTVSDLLQPRAEAEIAFVLARDLSGPGVTAADVIAATHYVLPAIEIVASRVADWKISIIDTVADNASAGMFVLGPEPQSLHGLDLALAGMKLSKNGRVVSTGAGAACMDHPVHAVAWLANTFGRLGTTLRAGEVILSGALGPVTPVVAGDFLDAEIAHLGRVSVRFA
ncbi:MAG: 2-oxopent-4-enoate hydratase [Bradymonadia bacterium]|jgi:2-oxopent-4-enoate hydratase